jgi:ABC-type nitrate/sulfonate/bicarbonate transport system substrate-binding protein
LALPLNLVYRSKNVQFPMLTAMKHSNAWERAGIELKSVKFVSGAANSDPMLIKGECDFIFGSHVSPYIHRMNGHPFVYLGQTVNWVDDCIITKQPISDLKDLNGKRFVEVAGAVPTGPHGHHPAGNHLLYLKREGIDPYGLTFVGATVKSMWPDVAEGRGDFTFSGPPDDEEAQAAGLHVYPLAPLPMVNGSTMTTLWPVLQERRDLCEAVLKATLMGIHFIKTQPDKMWELMQTEVATELKIKDEKALKHLHNYCQSILEPRLYPLAEAVANAFQLAVMESPGIEKKMNAMSLWDIHLLREIDESEFIDDLYGGNVPSPGTPPKRG